VEADHCQLYVGLVVNGGLSPLFRPFFRSPSPLLMRLLIPNLQAFLFVGAKANARILDVGSGCGYFVKLMHRYGYKSAVGIDPFLDKGAERSYIHRCELQSVSERYDLILFNHSLEHMTDPERAMRKCAELLSRDGGILVQVPNMDAREFAAYRQDWAWMHAPYHFAIPSRRGLDAMAGRCGFKVTDAACTSRFDHYLYHDEYRRDIADNDAGSIRRSVESGKFDPHRREELARLACSLNRSLKGDWIAYYLTRA